MEMIGQNYTRNSRHDLSVADNRYYVPGLACLHIRLLSGPISSFVIQLPIYRLLKQQNVYVVMISFRKG